MKDRWAQPSHMAEEFEALAQECLQGANNYLAIARVQAERYGMGTAVVFYQAAQTELDFAKFYKKQAKRLRLQSNPTEPQDPTAAK